MSGTSSQFPFDQYEPIAPTGRGRGGKRKWLLIGCAALGFLVVVATIVGVGAVVHFGLSVLAEEVKVELRDNPVVVEHLGRLDDLSLDFAASMAAKGANDYVFLAAGSAGSGVIRAECVTREDGSESVVSGTLELPTGETFDLFP